MLAVARDARSLQLVDDIAAVGYQRGPGIVFEQMSRGEGRIRGGHPEPDVAGFVLSGGTPDRVRARKRRQRQLHDLRANRLDSSRGMLTRNQWSLHVCVGN